MATKPSIDSLAIGRFLTIELARATELAAVAAARMRVLTRALLECPMRPVNVARPARRAPHLICLSG
jgi:hypothetical protein